MLLQTWIHVKFTINTDFPWIYWPEVNPKKSIFPPECQLPRQTPSERKVRGRKKERRRRIMPSLVAATSALARKMCVRTHFVRTNYCLLKPTKFYLDNNIGGVLYTLCLYLEDKTQLFLAKYSFCSHSLPLYSFALKFKVEKDKICNVLWL